MFLYLSFCKLNAFLSIFCAVYLPYKNKSFSSLFRKRSSTLSLLDRFAGFPSHVGFGIRSCVFPFASGLVPLRSAVLFQTLCPVFLRPRFSLRSLCLLWKTVLGRLPKSSRWTFLCGMLPPSRRDLLLPVARFRRRLSGYASSPWAFPRCWSSGVSLFCASPVLFPVPLFGPLSGFFAGVFL